LYLAAVQKALRPEFSKRGIRELWCSGVGEAMTASSKSGGQSFTGRGCYRAASSTSQGVFAAADAAGL